MRTKAFFQSIVKYTRFFPTELFDYISGTGVSAITSTDSEVGKNNYEYISSCFKAYIKYNNMLLIHQPTSLHVHIS